MPSQALLGRRASADWSFLVRINPLDTGLTLDDLAAVVRPGPRRHPGSEGQRRRGCRSRRALCSTCWRWPRASRLATSRCWSSRPRRRPRCSISAAMRAAHPRLVAHDLGRRRISARRSARSPTRKRTALDVPLSGGARAMPVRRRRRRRRALDTLYADFSDENGLAESCRIARRDGFIGRIAIHPDQVATINALLHAVGGRSRPCAPRRRRIRRRARRRHGRDRRQDVRHSASGGGAAHAGVRRRGESDG